MVIFIILVLSKSHKKKYGLYRLYAYVREVPHLILLEIYLVYQGLFPTNYLFDYVEITTESRSRFKLNTSQWLW